MKTDLYTKTVLTIIAVCMLVITFSPLNFIRKTQTLNTPNEVRIVSVDSSVMLDVNLSRILGWYPAIQHYSFTTKGDKSMAPIIFTEPISNDYE